MMFLPKCPDNTSTSQSLTERAVDRGSIYGHDSPYLSGGGQNKLLPREKNNHYITVYANAYTSKGNSVRFAESDIHIGYKECELAFRLRCLLITFSLYKQQWQFTLSNDFKHLLNCKTVSVSVTKIHSRFLILREYITLYVISLNDTYISSLDHWSIDI
jgi:hypothetical protein